MKRFFASLATFSLVETIGRHPALALGFMTLLGVGGPAVVANLMTPTIIPFASSNFNPNQSFGTNNNALKPNGGTAGAFEAPNGPSGGATGSFGQYFEAQVDPNLGYGNGSGESPFNGLILLANSSPGQPIFIYQRLVNGGIPGSSWWQLPYLAGTNFQGATAGSNYATGIYPFTATGGGGCAREPSGVWFGSSIQIVDPGFGCSVAATFSAASVPSSGAQQATGAGSVATTCSVINSQAVVTAHVAVAHGITPGLQYAMGSFTTSPSGVLNTTFTALGGATGTTLVGTPTTLLASCPTISSEGTALGGTGGAYTFPAVSASNPFANGGTGITTKNGQHICGFIGEYGDDSATPGFQFLTMTDDKGNALPGAPALSQNPNQSTASWTGFTTVSSATMNVTAMTPYTITSAAWSNTLSGFTGLGLVTFQVSTNPGLIAGSEFVVSGATPSSVNGTYIAVNGTTSTQVIGNHLTVAGGIPQALANPGAITFSSGQLISVIFPGMTVLSATGASVILPYGTASTTGTGSNAPATYQLNTVQTSALGSSGSPITIFAWMSYYYSAATGGSGPAGSVLTAFGRSGAGDFDAFIGSSSAGVGKVNAGWGGTLGNFAFLTGVLPSQSNAAPSITDLGSICTKQTDIRAYATANGLKTQALYRLNDPGIWGDSGNATITGYITNSSGTNATLNVVSTVFGSLALSTGTQTGELTGVGLPVAAPVTIPLTTSSSATYAITANTTPARGSLGSPVTFAVGAFKPALPNQANTIKGYIDTTTGVSTLHVTSLDDGTSHSGFAGFTGTLGTSFTASVAAGTSSNGAPSGSGLLTVTAPTGVQPTSSYIGIGTIVCPAVGSSAFTCTTVMGYAVSPATPGIGLNGSYVVDNPAVVTSQVMFGSGQLPGPATTLQATSITGALQTGMAVSDGGASLTGSPLLITGGSGSVWSVAGNYYPPIAADSTMQGTLTTLVTGEYLQNSAITNPVKVVADPTNGNGLSGTYKLSGSPNASGIVGSSGSPVVITGTTITDGGVVAPGPALTIRDQGPSITFPLTNIGAKTGTLALSGTYDTGTLGGTPSGIQVTVSNTANGPALAGCSPCNLGTLTATISGGAWSGTIAGIPGGGPYFVSVRAANGTAYATLPNSIKVGWAFALWGQGQADSMQNMQSGTYTSFFSGLWGYFQWESTFSGLEHYIQGPPITANFVSGQTQNFGGDRFGVLAGGAPLSEAVSAFDQELGNIFSVPTTFISSTRDGVGIGGFALGNAAETQTVGAGDGSTLIWCSASKFCASAGVSPAGPLVFGASSLTGGWFTGAITNPGSVPTLTIGSSGRIGGALEPGLVLNTPNDPTLVMCLTGCSSQMLYNGSTWLLSNALDAGGGSIAMSAAPIGGAPWPNLNLQGNGSSAYPFAGFGWPLVKAGTFTVSVNGTVVCQDSGAFAYNNTGGNCTGATIASSFVNYQTGDYQITFTSGHAPALNAAVIASWTNIISPETVSSTLSRPQGVDYFGDGSAQSGAVSALFSRTPGGVNGHIYSGMGTDHDIIENNAGPSNVGYQWGALGYSQLVSWLYGVKFPATMPGASASVPFLTTGQWRQEGPVAFSTTKQDEEDSGLYDQWAMDAVTKSTFNGHISGTVLTLDSNATGPMWEGEIIACVTFSSNCPTGPLSGVYITGLHSGAWGVVGSAYDLAGGVSNIPVAGQPFSNPVYYSGPGSAYYVGALNDIIVQTNGLATTTIREVHPSNGFAGGRRATSRWAAMIYGANGGSATDPQLSRANDSAGGTPSPAFDYGITYAASHAASWTTAGVFTVVGGIGSNDRPFVVGQSVTCSPSCGSNLVITSVSLPPTIDPRAGHGQAMQTFTFQVAGAVSSNSSGTATAGCTSGSGGSNCINIDVSSNVSGTFETAAALDTCGANNLNGNAPNYVVPNGECQGNGIGSIIRAFRIGTNQLMYGDAMTSMTPGSVFDDSVDPANGAFNQSAAFTCNIVAAKVVQCVKGPAYSSGVFSSVGKWASGSTFISYGDTTIVSGRIASLLGYVGGQSFPFTPGSGYTNGTTQPTVTCTTIQSGGVVPKFDVTVSGGAIVNVVPSAVATGTVPAGLGIGSTCTVALPAGGSGGTIPTISLAPLEGVGGIATYNTDSNTMGLFLYDNSGEPGNPLNSFFTNGQGGYFEPGLPVRPFGEFQGAAVSG